MLHVYAVRFDMTVENFYKILWELNKAEVRDIV